MKVATWISLESVSEFQNAFFCDSILRLEESSLKICLHCCPYFFFFNSCKWCSDGRRRGKWCSEGTFKGTFQGTLRSVAKMEIVFKKWFPVEARVPFLQKKSFFRNGNVFISNSIAILASFQKKFLFSNSIAILTSFPQKVCTCIYSHFASTLSSVWVRTFLLFCS